MYKLKRKDYAFLAIRVLAVYIFVQSLKLLSNIFMFTLLPSINYGTNLETAIIVGSLGPFFTLFILAILLWIYTDRIATILLPSSDDDSDIQGSDNTSHQLSKETLLSISIYLVGLIIIVNTLPEIFYTISNYIQYKAVEGATNLQFKYQVYSQIAEKALSLILGIYLMIGNKGLVKLYKKINGM